MVSHTGLILRYIDVFMNAADKPSSTILDCRIVPPMDVKDYINRILQYGDNSEDVIIHCLYYVEKCCEIHKLTLFNFHKLFAVCYLLSVKFVSDYHYCNAHYAKVFGVTIEEINCLEIYVLQLLNFRLYFKNENYEKVKKKFMTNTNSLNLL